MTAFSARTPLSFHPNHLSRRAAELRAAGAPLADLTLSNPTQAGIPLPGDAVLAALADPRALGYDPAPQGLPGAREAIAAWHARHAPAADPASFFLTSSTSEAYSWLFKLLCDAGDSVMTPRPSYPLFECLADLEGVRAVQYPLAEQWRWDIDLAMLERCLDPRARAIILVNPNHPTGAYLKPGDWLRLQEFAALRGLAIIADEVFFDYAWSPATPRISTLAPPHLTLTFTLAGLSKTAGLPQMKLGWIHVAGPEEQRRQAIERLEWIADAYLPASAPVQYAVPRWLALAPRIQSRILDHVLANRQALLDALPEHSPWRVLPSAGGWTALLEAPRIHTEEEWALLFLEAFHVLVQPGFFYDFDREAFLAVSLLARPETFAEALARLSGIFGSI